MPRNVQILAILGLAASPLPSQEQVLPAELSGLPGNAAISMPARWSQGVMQVIWDQAVIPDELKDRTVTSLRLRRPAFANEPDYAGVSRTVRISMAMTLRSATQMAADPVENRPETLTVVKASAAVSIPATVAHGPGDAQGATMIDVTLDQPFLIEGTGNLFLEWENIDTSLSIDAENWVDAVQLPASGGVALEVGNGGCGSVADPMVLTWIEGVPPAIGEQTSLLLQGAVPSAPALVVLGLDPENMQEPLNLGFGAELDSLFMPGCYQWTGAVLALPLTVNPVGSLRVDLPFPASPVLSGKRVGVQVLVTDPQANPTGFGLSNAVLLLLDTVGFGQEVATLMMPGDGSLPAFQPFLGVAPVVTFGF